MRTTSTITAAAAVFGAAILGLASPSLAAWANSSTSGHVISSTGTSPEPTGTSGLPWTYIMLDPSTVVAGGEVSILACPSDQSGTATSSVFGTVPLTQTNGITAYGRAKVPATTKPGSHRIDVRCSDGRIGTRDLNVVAASESTKPRPQTTQKPSGAPETGGGGASGVTR